MAAIAAARSILRSSPLRNAVSKLATKSIAAARPALRVPKQRPAAIPRIGLRSPVEMSSFCVESLLPMHSATASALMNSMLSVSRRGYGWISEDG